MSKHIQKNISLFGLAPQQKQLPKKAQNRRTDPLQELAMAQQANEAYKALYTLWQMQQQAN